MRAGPPDGKSGKPESPLQRARWGKRRRGYIFTAPLSQLKTAVAGEKLKHGTRVLESWLRALIELREKREKQENERSAPKRVSLSGLESRRRWEPTARKRRNMFMGAERMWEAQTQLSPVASHV